jgi:general secretion pathway protein G
MASLLCSKKASMLILVLLLSLTCGCLTRYGPNEIRAKEAILKEDLYSMRLAIDQFTQDKGQPPDSFSALIEAGYLRDVPQDPFTRSRLTWKAVYEDNPPTPDDTPRRRPQDLPRRHGITDVHSGSDQISSEATPYNKW